MPLPTTVTAYNDVRSIADSAIRHGSGAMLEFPSRAEAIRFRQRFYQLRKLLRNRSPDETTPYDNCVLRDGPDYKKLRLEITSAQPVIVTFDNPEAVVEQSPAIPPQDNLMAEALALAKKLGLDTP
jgi:hypothetical protein